MGAFFSIVRCFFCRPVEKQSKMKKGLMRAIIRIIRCFIYGRVEKLRKIKKDLMEAIITLIRCFIFRPLAKLRKIKKDLRGGIISAVRFICRLLEKPRKIKKDELSLERIYPEESKVIENVAEREEEILKIVEVGAEMNFEEHIKKNQEACLLPELHSKEPTEKKQGTCLQEELHSEEPIENIEGGEPRIIKCMVSEEKWINHYSSFQKILLVGECDFSFSASLAMSFGSASNMIATSHDSEEFLRTNYGSVINNIKNLNSRGCRVLHGVDAKMMANNPLLKGMTFDRIIFNFPFAGFPETESPESQLRERRRLMSLFLKNAKEMISETGEIHITEEINTFNSEWNIEQLASCHQLVLKEAVHFNCIDYPSYSTKHGFGGNDVPNKTYKFGHKDASTKRKRKKKKNSEPIGTNQEACLLGELHSQKPIQNVEEREQEVCMDRATAEEEKASDDAGLIPHSCLDTFINSISTCTSHDQNDKEFEEYKDHQSISSTSGSLQKEVLISSPSFLSCEAPKAHGSIQQDFEMSGLDTLINNTEFVEGKKEDACLPKELHSQEQVKKKKEGLLVHELEESIENKQNSCLVNELDEPIEKKQGACLLDELYCKEPTENIEEREQGDTKILVAEERWISSYSSFQKILLVDESNFSFSASLGMAFGSASNMIATSVNSVELSRTNYRSAITNIKNLTCRGCRVLHGIDAKQMANNPLLKGMIFDRIIFNFPFSGFLKSVSLESHLRGYRRLVSLFLKNAKKMISETGEIHITEEINAFNSEQDIEDLASSHQLVLKEAEHFNCINYPCYSTKHGSGGNDIPSKMYKFGHRDASTKSKRKKKKNSEPIGTNQDACLVGELCSQKPIQNVEEREQEVCTDRAAEEERGSNRSHDAVLIPDTCLDTFRNSISTDTSHDQNDKEFEECTSTSGSLQKEVLISLPGLEAPKAHGSFQHHFEVSGLYTLINNSEFVEGEKGGACLELHSQEQIKNRKEGFLVNELEESIVNKQNSCSCSVNELESSIENKQNSCSVNELDEAIENKEGACLIDELHCKEQTENVEEREQGDTKRLVAGERWISSYSSFQKILLVGEGDFSFSASLAMAFGSASNMIATSVDPVELSKTYRSAITNIMDLTSRGCRVLHGIDAKQMANNPLLKGMIFDRIIFNFPFSICVKTESPESQLRGHRQLVSLFLKNGKEMISETGEIHITEEINAFNSEWNIEELASCHRLVLKEAVHFKSIDHTCSSTKHVFGGNNIPSKTYKFGHKDSPTKRKRKKKKSPEPIGMNQDACLLGGLHSQKPIQKVEERKQELCTDQVAEGERGSDRNHDAALIPHTCLDTFKNSVLTDTSHDLNDKEFEACEDYRSNSSTSGSLQKEILVTLPSFLSGEGQNAHGRFQQDLKVSGLDNLINNSEFVKGKKGGACLPNELHSQEQIEKKKEGYLVNEFEEPIKNKDSSLANELDEPIEKKQGACLLDELHCKEPTENVEEREQGDTKSVVPEERWISSYSSFQKILLVGEGDLSFSASLAMAFGSASNMIATSVDSEDLSRTNYRSAIANIKNLTSRGCRVLHGVDAKEMADNPMLKGMTFDRIIFNFPFSGFVKTESLDSQLRGHRRLVSLFLKNAKEMINETGEIHITQETKAFDSEWNIEQLASCHQLRLIEEVHFNRTDYPGYSPRHGFGRNDLFICNSSKTYKFGHKHASTKRKGKKKNTEPIGKKQNACWVEKVRNGESVKNVEARGKEVIIGVVAEEKRGSKRGSNSVLIPLTCLDSFQNSKSTDTLHDQNDIEFPKFQDYVRNLSPTSADILHDQNYISSDECQDYQSNLSTSGSQEQEVFISAASSPHWEDPNLHGTFHLDLGVPGLITMLENTKSMEVKKEDACLLEEQHTKEPIEKKKEVCLLFQQHSKEPTEKNQDVRYQLELHPTESIENQKGACLLEEFHSKKPIENVEGEQIDIKGVGTEERWIKHYSSLQNILLVGEGDFSFSASLAKAFRSASHMIATSLDSEEFLSDHYLSAIANIKNLTSWGCRVFHGVDATKMANNQLLKCKKFDRIIFNFPFAGFFKNELRYLQLWRHQHLVSLFLENAKEMINAMGEIHITHKTNGFHSEWNIEELASLHGLRLIETVNFNCSDYPGYNTKCGFGGDNNFDCNPSKTYKFGLNNAKNAADKKKKKKKEKDLRFQADLSCSFNRTMMEYTHVLPPYLDCSPSGVFQPMPSPPYLDGSHPGPFQPMASPPYLDCSPGVFQPMASPPYFDCSPPGLFELIAPFAGVSQPIAPFSDVINANHPYSSNWSL